MAQLELRGVHVMKKVPGVNAFRLAEINPAVRISRDGEHVWLQKGKFFDDGGRLLKKLPSWLSEELVKLNPDALAEAGYKGREAVKGD